MNTKWSRIFWGLVVCVGCLFISTTSFAHPGAMWGIDVNSVLTIHDQARVLGHQHEANEGDADEQPRLDGIRTIVIDPGHGGDNSGATGVAGIPEKFLNLDLAYDLRDRLQQRYPRLRVVMTRYHDDSIGLSERVDMANAVDADLLISLHYNAATHDRAVGFETYFLDADQVTPGHGDPQGLPVATTDNALGAPAPAIDGVSPIEQSGDTLELIHRDLLRAHRHHLSGSLAEAIQAQFVEQLDSIDRGVKQGNFTVLEGSDMPAVVVEAGFLTHPEEGREVLGAEHRSAVVDSLLTAVEDFDDELEATLDNPGDVAGEEHHDEPVEENQDQTEQRPDSAPPVAGQLHEASASITAQ